MCRTLSGISFGNMFEKQLVHFDIKNQLNELRHKNLDTNFEKSH